MDRFCVCLPETQSPPGKLSDDQSNIVFPNSPKTGFQLKTAVRSIFVKINSNICFLRIFGAEFLTETGFDV
jgi:hypothetical protein